MPFARPASDAPISANTLTVWHHGQAYGQDLRDRVLNAPGSMREVAARFGVSQSYVAWARFRWRRHGAETPGRQCNQVPSKLSGLEPALADQAASVNDLTLQQLCAWLHAEHGIQVGITAMGKASARLGLSLKKIAPCRSALLQTQHKFRKGVRFKRAAD
jgi:transposase